MKSHVQLQMTFENAATAEAVASSVAPDDEGYIETTRRGRTIIARATADSLMSLMHTLDDYLACVSVAERTSRETRPRGPARRGRA